MVGVEGFHKGEASPISTILQNPSLPPLPCTLPSKDVLFIFVPFAQLLLPSDIRPPLTMQKALPPLSPPWGTERG